MTMKPPATIQEKAEKYWGFPEFILVLIGSYSAAYTVHSIEEMHRYVSDCMLPLQILRTADGKRYSNLGEVYADQSNAAFTSIEKKEK